MKPALYFIAGLLWILFGIGFAVLLIEYLNQGAGTQHYLPLISSGGVLLGMVHFTGLVLASVFSSVIGIGFCARGLATRQSADRPKIAPPGDS